MTVPVYIRYNETDEKSQQKVADAVISLVDGNITVKALLLLNCPIMPCYLEKPARWWKNS